MLPLVALLVRAPWSGLPELLSDSQVLTALRLSLECATAATIVSLILGVPLAWVLARLRFPGLGLVRALVTLPLVLPPVVGGLALLLAFGRNGIIGRYLDDWFGITLPFTTAGVIVAETFVAMPFLVITVEGALRSADLGLEEAATTLGAPASRSSVGSRCRWSALRCSPARCFAGPAPSASSVRRSPSPATFLAQRRPCRSRSTTRWRLIPKRPSRSAWYCSSLR